METVEARGKGVASSRVALLYIHRSRQEFLLVAVLLLSTDKLVSRAGNEIKRDSQVGRGNQEERWTAAEGGGTDGLVNWMEEEEEEEEVEAEVEVEVVNGEADVCCGCMSGGLRGPAVAAAAGMATVVEVFGAEGWNLPSLSKYPASFSLRRSEYWGTGFSSIGLLYCLWDWP